MRRILQVVMLAVCVGATAELAVAACGDGVVQAGEQCDPGAPAGEVACPGRCVPVPIVDACHCTAVSTDPRDFAAIVDFQARLAPTANVSGGGVAVTTTGGFLSVGAEASISNDHQAIGDRCRLLPHSSVGRLFCNDPIVFPDAFIALGGNFLFTPPLAFPSLPPFMTGSGGGTDVDVPARSTKYLAPGTYGNLIVERGGTLVLHGLDAGSGSGRYDVLAVKVIDGGTLLADNPVQVNVKNALRLTGEAVLAPSVPSILPGDVRFDVEGRGAKLGKGALAQAHVRAPNGKITVGRGTLAIGRMIASKLVVQKNAVLANLGGCGDGIKQGTEICDTSAANGDQACPGDCIPFGQAGQCTCRCTSNAECNDGNACNGVETCSAGHCVLGTPPDCDDDNPCTIDCAPNSGCIQVPLADDTGCDDGNQCTTGDFCQGGACVAGAPRACNDGNDCTADACDPTHGCSHTALATGLACSDGDMCTQADACIRGNCISGSTISCDDSNPCTVDSCDPLTGCRHDPVTDGISCAGTSPCSTLDTCQGGVCIGRGAQICSDGKECTVDSCTPVGPVGSQTPQCSSSNAANFTPCGPSGTKSCFNGVCL
jgi:hypothetical protein